MLHAHVNTTKAHASPTAGTHARTLRMAVLSSVPLLFLV
jgi:hypothetical protein